MKKLSGKADLTIYNYSVVVSGYCMSVAIKLANKRDSNSYAYMLEFPRPGHILFLHHVKFIHKMQHLALVFYKEHPLNILIIMH